QIARISIVSRSESRRVGWRLDRQFRERAKGFVLAAIVKAENDLFIRKLGLEMEGGFHKGAYERSPVTAVWMDAPEAPIQTGAKTSLVFQGTEHDAPILENHRMQGAADV